MILQAALIGIIGGILSGLLGIGGGIVLVPMLVNFIGMSQKSAQGTSLGALLLPVGIFAALKYHKSGHLDIKFSIILAIFLAVGAYFGAYLTDYLPEPILRKLFGVLLAGVSIKFLFF